MGDHGLRVGTPDIASVGPITFGPDEVLFVADSVNGKVVAIDVADPGGDGPASAFDLDDLDTKLAAFLGCADDDVILRDMAVHPRTHNVYLSVMRGRGSDAIPLILRIDHHDAAIAEVALADVAFAEASITNAPAVDDPRTDFRFADAPEGEVFERNGRTFRIARPSARESTVTDMAYVDGTLLVAGLSNEEFSSNLRRLPFPFTGEVLDNSLEIFHVAHGKWETAAPIRTFVPFDGGRSILASYTCTPLVHFPLDALTSGTQARGRTVAELGAGNQPLDIVSYRQGDAEFLLICHSTHPVMKIDASTIAGQDALVEPQEPRGVPREELALAPTRLLANLNGDYVLALQLDESGRRHLRSLKTASL
ncbi:MAG: hypothetical protein QOI42_2038 [Frankiaceae bacterium]|jgi:hypothetical protein|nr:hypothetical protein [Frankiaceae bacterium]